MNDLIGIPQVAEILGMNRQTVWLWYKAERLKPSLVIQTKSGQRPRPFFNRQYIEAFAETRKSAA